MHRTLQLPWRAPRKRTNSPVGNCQISKSGGLFAQGSNPVGRRQSQFLAEIRERALSKIRKAEQCLVRNLAHLANGFQSAARRAFWILVENRTRSIGESSGSSGVGASIGPSVASRTKRSSQALPIFMECCLGLFMIGDRLFASDLRALSLSSGRTRISAFLVLGHFRFAFTRLPSMKATQ